MIFILIHYMFAYVIVSLYFIICSIRVVQASGECLRGVLATKSGQTAHHSLQSEALDWTLYLQPFTQQRKKKVSTLVTIQTHSCLYGININ